MEPFSTFDPWRAGDLNVASDGIFSGRFTLADEIKTYAEILYTPKLRSIAQINAALQSWTLYSGQGFFSRDILINDAGNQQAAIVKTSFWLARISIEFADGQIFKFKRPTVFTKTLHWYNEQYGNVLTTEGSIFALKPQLKVIPEQGMFKNSDQLLLMIFATVHMVYMRKVRAGYVSDK